MVRLNDQTLKVTALRVSFFLSQCFFLFQHDDDAS